MHVITTAPEPHRYKLGEETLDKIAEACNAVSLSDGL
jgi:hypothetical protein